MRKGFEPPKQGEIWAGWVPELDNVRRLEIVQVHGPDAFTVSYTKRGEGTLETVVSLMYLIQPWDSYKQEQQERRNQQKQVQEMQSALHAAIAGAGMSCGMPWVYAGGSCSLHLDFRSAQMLLGGLEKMAAGDNSNSSLARIFG